LIALFAAGCGSKARNYSADEVKAAFRDAGVPLVTTLSPPRGRSGGVLAAAHLGGEFVVVVFEDEQTAKVAYERQRSQATRDSFDRLIRNVLVSGERLSSRDRRKVADALDRLRS
jgi:hypothetical protein